MGNSCPEAVSIVVLIALYQPQQFIPEFKSGCLGILYGTNANQMLILPKGALAFKGNGWIFGHIGFTGQHERRSMCDHDSQSLFLTDVGNVFRVVSEKDIFTNPHWTSPRLLETGGLFQPSSCHAEALFFCVDCKDIPLNFQ